MSYVEELIEKTKQANKSGKYWVELYDEIMNFFNGKYPKEEKIKLKRKGMIEKVVMLYDGYKDEVKILKDE